MEFIKEIKTTLLVMAGFYIIMGLLMLLFPQLVSNTICYVIGAICLITGGLAVYTYVASQIYGPLAMLTLVIAIVFIGLGLFIFLNPETFASFIPLVMGIVLALEGLSKFQSSVTLKKYNYDKWWEILAGAIVVFAFGIVLLLNPFTSLIILIRILGFFLIIDGVSNILTSLSYTKIEHAIK